MSQNTIIRELYKTCNIGQDHQKSDYFSLIRELVHLRNVEGESWQKNIDQTYSLVMDEIICNENPPRTVVKFGTSGWRGMIGKEIGRASCRERVFRAV